MSTTTVAAPTTTFRPGWLFSPRADVTMLLLPALSVAAAAVLAFERGHDSADVERVYATWISQFLLGNSTHVILTFLLLGARRDMLHATPGQARTVKLGASITFLVTFGMMFGVSRLAPIWIDFPFAIIVVLATHHTLSQARGIWSLYNLRGKRFGIPPPAEAERNLQKWFVPLGLLLITVKFLFVPKTEGSTFAFVQAIPLMPAVLPYEVTYLLGAAWLLFVGLLGRALLSAEGPKSYPKLGYVACHSAAVLLMLAAPGWGSTLVSGVHGLEYYLLSARMLRPLPSETSAKIGAALVWPALVGAMLPLFVIGLVNAPFTGLLGLPRSFTPAFSVARWVLTATVLAHYFSDAFIYRFRIPEVRKVALARLGFD